MLELILLSLGLLLRHRRTVAGDVEGPRCLKTIACVGGMGAAALLCRRRRRAVPDSHLRQLDRAYALHELHALAESAGRPSSRSSPRWPTWRGSTDFPTDEYYEAGIGVIGFFMNLFIASMNLVILADNAFWFLVFFELMSLTSYVLVIIDRTEASLKGGFLYLIMAHIGFLMIACSFFAMASATGSLEFEAFRTPCICPRHRHAGLRAGLFGFGAKAGMVPFPIRGCLRPIRRRPPT